MSLENELRMHVCVHTHIFMLLYYITYVYTMYSIYVMCTTSND